jgi:putative transposase
MANYQRVFLNGYSYFITMVTHRREPHLTEHIDLLRKSFYLSMQRYAYRLEGIVVLPDHLHMVITPKHAADYPKIVSHIKRSFVYGLNASIKEQMKTTLSSSSYLRQRSGVWQKRYYEHTIRNEKDMMEKMDYMYHNPVKHGYVEVAEKWRYSSFFKSMNGAVGTQHPTETHQNTITY